MPLTRQLYWLLNLEIFCDSIQWYSSDDDLKFHELTILCNHGESLELRYTKLLQTPN